MYKKVLVPLDGSELAECALIHVKSLTKDGSIGEVILFRVVVDELPLFDTDGVIMPNFDYEAWRKSLLEEAQKYLGDAQSRLAAEGIKTELTIREGNRPAQIITDFAQKNGIDLIILATHGYTGMKKLMFGSVALSVLQDAAVPVLLIRPEACR